MKEGRATGGQRPGEAHGARMAKRSEVGDDKRAPPIGGGERREGGRWNGPAGLTGPSGGMWAGVERRKERGRRRGLGLGWKEGEGERDGDGLWLFLFFFSSFLILKGCYKNQLLL